MAALLFNSFGFLFFYLPVVLGGFFLLGRIGKRWAALWLALASLFFYGYWNVRYLPLLLGSIVFNYWSARAIMAAEGAARRRRLPEADRSRFPGRLSRRLCHTRGNRRPLIAGNADPVTS